MTVAQIRRLVPVLSDRAIRSHLAAGRRTRAAMLTFDPAAASSRGGTITARNNRSRAIRFGRKLADPSAI